MPNQPINRSVNLTWNFILCHFKEITIGCIFGCITGFVVPTLVHLWLLLDAQSAHALWLGNKYVQSFVSWPKRGTATIIILAALVASFYGVRLRRFLAKIVSSLSAGLVSGTTLLWFVSSALAIALFNWTGSALSFFVLAAGLFGTFLIASHDLQIAQRTQGASEIDPDRPIDSSDEDILGRGAVVETIVRAIVSDRTPVIALTGAYGDGKTSVFNLVSKELEKRRDVLVVPFSTWLPMDVETLVSSLLGSVLARLEKGFFVPRIKRNLLDFTRMLFAVVPGIPSSFKDLIERPSQSDQTEELKRNLSRLPIRIAILLDDIDRLQRTELEVLFKLLRGVHEFPQLTFVCAFHFHALVQILKKDYPNEEAQRFLEKFFPDEIPLPKIEEARLAVIFEKRFYEICDKNKLITSAADRDQFKQELRTVWQMYLKAYFTNLRRLKIFANRLNRSLPIVGNEVNLHDFVLLEVVRMMNPLLYEEIFRNARYFMFGQWRVTTWLDIVDVDEAEAQRRRKVFFDQLFKELPKPPEGILLGILKEIFPTVSAYLSDSVSPIPATQSPEEAQRQHRVYHPDFFPRYFIFQVPEDLFGEEELSKFIAKMNAETDQSKCIAIFEEKYAELEQLSMKRWDFLRRVGFSIERFSDAATQALPLAVASLSDKLEADGVGSFDELAAHRIVFRAADRLESSPGAQTVLEKVIGAASSDRFATEILNESGPRNADFRSRKSINKEKLEDAFRTRMNTKYGGTGKASFFPKDGRKDIVPLGRWALCGPEGKEQVREYLRHEFHRDHSNVGKFLTFIFLDKRNVDQDLQHPSLSDPLKTTEIYFPVEELNKLLNKYGTSAYASADESRAVQDFKSTYKPTQ